MSDALRLTDDARVYIYEKYRFKSRLYNEVRERFGIQLSPTQWSNVYHKETKETNLLYMMSLAACLGSEVEMVLSPPPEVRVKRTIDAVFSAQAMEFIVRKDREGRRIAHYGARYERKPALRLAAIRLHGLTCMGCGFNFEQWYGERGRDYIEVHHCKPLCEGEQEVDPRTDLVVLCANCHAMVHADPNPTLSVEELKKIAPIISNRGAIRRRA